MVSVSLLEAASRGEKKPAADHPGGLVEPLAMSGIQRRRRSAYVSRIRNAGAEMRYVDRYPTP